MNVGVTILQVCGFNYEMFYSTCSGHVQYHDFLRVVGLKACLLADEVSYHMAAFFLNTTCLDLL